MALKKKKLKPGGIRRGPVRARKAKRPIEEVENPPDVQRIVKWNDDFYVTAYKLARQGMTNNDIMSFIGVTKPTFIDWVRRRPALNKALEQGRSDKDANFQASFRDYVYQRLSPDLKELWEEINRCERKDSGFERVEGLLEAKGDRARQHLFLYALVHCNFNPSEACKKIGISTTKLKKWTHNEPEFRELLDEMHWHKGNFFEEGLVKLVREGDTKAIVFANERYNRDRGYGNKVEVKHSGSVNHTHMIDVDALELDPETKLKLLEAVRLQKQKALPPIDVEVNRIAQDLTEEDDE